jgi:fatty acid-binding protein DegV
MQTLTLAVDASCDLPKALYQRLELSTLPLNWMAAPEGLTPDDRTDAVTEAWYLALGAEPAKPVTDPLNDTRLGNYLDDTWLLTSDGTLLITPAKHRHPGYDHWHKQATTLQPQLDQVRHAANLNGHYRLRVVDSGQTLAAYGLLVQAIATLHRDKGYSIDKLRLPLLSFSARITHLFSVPAFANPERYTQIPVFPRLGWLRRSVMGQQKKMPMFRAQDGEEKLVGGVRQDTSISSVVEQFCKELEQSRLSHSTVNASFAGPIDQLHQDPAIKRLHQQVTRQGGHVWLSQMAGSSALVFGAGAFSLAFVN